MARIKPKTSVRKPPAAADEFVNGTPKREDGQEFKSSGVQKSEGLDVKTPKPAKGRPASRLTNASAGTSKSSKSQTSKGSAVEASKRLEVQETKQESGQTSERSKRVVERKDGTQLRRMTVYMPPELAKRLKIVAATTDREMSAIVTEAVGAWLDANA